MATNIFWFRNDLRLADNPGLDAALRSADETVTIYVLDDQSAGAWAMGGASRWWLHYSLRSLAAAIAACGSQLVLRRGDAGSIIPKLAADLRATGIYASRRVEPWGRAQDRAISTRLKPSGIGMHRYLAGQLFPPESINTKTGGKYGVFTPFARACSERNPAAVIAPPEKIAGPAGVASEDLDDWGLTPAMPDWAGGLRESWQPGEAGAAKRLQRFIRDAMPGYSIARDIPSQDGTSGLSPHLHFGEISPTAVWHAAVAGKPGPGQKSFLNELLWHEFAAYLLWHHPQLPEQNLRKEFDAFAWAEDEGSLSAWQRGLTGIPIVDAGMRQLWQTGWMHNRIRMVCASFLIKHLLIPWQTGEAWFWDTLVDADLATNAVSWQWVAGSGADAAPYFRIFNPVLQSRKFDAAGGYIRKYVPELRELPDKHIHAPWEADAAVLAAANVTLGDSYPRPIVDLARGRERALAAYREITGGKPTGDQDE
jgi:deoxyribodipyrimidine photo-lyase